MVSREQFYHVEKVVKRTWRNWSELNGVYPLIWIALLLTLGAYFWRLHLLRVRGFDPDEFEHLHAAWYISKGMLPYRDFFEHHTPWLHFFLAPFFVFFDVETNSTEAHAFLYFARMWMWLFAGAILALTLWLGTLWRDVRVGSVAAVLLGNTLMFLEKTLEVRPDVPSTALWVACLVTVVRGIREREPSCKIRWRFAWSGVCLGSAVMCNQKMLFAFPGFALAMLWHIADPRSQGTLRERLRNLGYGIAGLFVPILLTLAYFASWESLDEFIEFNFFFNSRWKVRFSPTYYLTELMRQNPIFVALAIVGFLRALLGMFGRERFRRGEFVYVLNALGLFVGLFIIPVPHRQYYVMFFPLGAIFAAGLLIDAVDGIATIWRVRPKSAFAYLYILAETGVFIAVLAFVFQTAPRVLSDRFYLVTWSIAFALAVALLLLSWKDMAIAVLLIALSAYPIKQMRNAAGWTNTVDLKEIRYVIENTSPTETCMDGWTGRGVFRPHAWFYWFLHEEIRAMLSEESKDELLSSLRSGHVAPRLIFLDDDLNDLSRGTARFFIEHYEPVGVGRIWRRK